MASPVVKIVHYTTSSRDTDSELVVMCNGFRVYIEMTAKNLERSTTVKRRYLDHLQAMKSKEGEEPQDEEWWAFEDLCEWLLEGFTPELLRVLPPPNYPPTPTLQHWLTAETRHYLLHANEDGTFFLADNPHPDGRAPHMGVKIDEEFCTPFKSFGPTDLQICAESPQEAFGAVPKKVRTDNGHVHFLKPYEFSDGARAQEELNKYEAMDRADLGDLRVCRLFGIVRDKDGTLLGLLLTYIDCHYTTLLCAAKPDTPTSLRNRWVHQVTQSVHGLHAAGITWGDAKPDNVLIDEEDNAWVIDFGGSYTRGWVDEDVAGTVQGDLQGLSRIVDYVEGKEEV